MSASTTPPASSNPATQSVVRIRVTYAECDRMGFLHHSNHLRWFERGREEFCRRRNAGYREMEDAGVLVVVVDATVHYRAPLRFEDQVDLRVRLTEVRHASLVFEYEMRRVGDGLIVATGRTRHAFVTRDGRVLRASDEVRALLTAPESVTRRGEIE
jgi:acyl-CoA thioester hydrolase